MAQEAGDVVVSTVADAVAARRGWDTATDQHTEFLLTSLNALVADEYRSRNRGLLVSALVEASIPNGVTELDVRTYSTIRDEFAGVRSEFARAVASLNAVHRIDDIGDSGTLRARVEEVTAAFADELTKARRALTRRSITQWVPWAVSSLATLAGAVASQPPWSLAIAGVAVVAGLAGQIAIRSEPEVPPLQRMIVTMRHEIEYQRQLQEIL